MKIDYFLKFLMLLSITILQFGSYAQDHGNGGVVKGEDEVFTVDKDGHPIINLHEKIDKKLAVSARFKKIHKNVKHFLDLASKDITTCQGKEIKFNTISDFHLFLVARNAVYTITTSSFYSTPEQTCNKTPSKAPETCNFSKETTIALKTLIKNKMFLEYLIFIEDVKSNVARDTETYFEGLFK